LQCEADNAVASKWAIDQTAGKHVQKASACEASLQTRPQRQ
jgi:hypothetical protein